MPKQRVKSRNKRKQASPSSGVPVPLALVLVLAGLICTSYLWLCGRADSLANKIKRLENKNMMVAEDIVNEQYKWSKKIAPERLRATLKKLRIKMDWPKDNQVVHIYNMDLYLNKEMASVSGETGTP